MAPESPDLPLEGIHVLITRPAPQTASMASKLIELGARVTSHPVIDIEHRFRSPLARQHLDDLGAYCCLVFLSKNAAISFIESQADSLAKLPLPPVVAIGIGTKSVLESNGLCGVAVPPKSNSESLARWLIENRDPSPDSPPALILRADRGSDELANTLAANQYPFVELPIYSIRDLPAADPKVAQQVAAGRIDWITITSSAIARSVARLFEFDFSQTQIVSISPKTTSVALQSGLQVHAEAVVYNEDGLIEAMLNHEREHGHHD